MEKLHTLDLRGNMIDDLEQIEYLTLCPELRSLQLQDNPIFNHKNEEAACESISKMLTKLESLNKPQPEAELKVFSIKPNTDARGFQRQRFKATSSASKKDEPDSFSKLEANPLPPIYKPTIRAAFRLNSAK